MSGAYQKGRRSRARQPSEESHGQVRERARERMATYRAKNKAQKRALQLRSFLSEDERREIEARVARSRYDILRDWFVSRDMKFYPKIVSKMDVLRSFMTKLDMHRVDLQVAEFEIAIIQARYSGIANNIALFNRFRSGVGGGYLTGGIVKDGSNSMEVFTNDRGQALTNDGADIIVKKDMISSDIRSKGVVEAESTNPVISTIADAQSAEYSIIGNENNDGILLTHDEIDDFFSKGVAPDTGEDAPEVLGAVEVERTNPHIFSSGAYMQTSGGEVLNDHDDELLRMDLQDFVVDNSLVFGAERFCFHADAFSW